MIWVWYEIKRLVQNHSKRWFKISLKKGLNVQFSFNHCFSNFQLEFRKLLNSSATVSFRPCGHSYCTANVYISQASNRFSLKMVDRPSWKKKTFRTSWFCETREWNNNKGWERMLCCTHFSLFGVLFDVSISLIGHFVICPRYILWILLLEP